METTNSVIMEEDILERTKKVLTLITYNLSIQNLRLYGHTDVVNPLIALGYCGSFLNLLDRNKKTHPASIITDNEFIWDRISRSNIPALDLDNLDCKIITHNALLKSYPQFSKKQPIIVKEVFVQNGISLEDTIINIADEISENGGDLKLSRIILPSLDDSERLAYQLKEIEKNYLFKICDGKDFEDGMSKDIRKVAKRDVVKLKLLNEMCAELIAKYE